MRDYNKAFGTISHAFVYCDKIESVEGGEDLLKQLYQLGTDHADDLGRLISKKGGLLDQVAVVAAKADD